MIKAVLFDLDGVLFNTEVYDRDVMVNYLKEINSPLPVLRLNKLICPNHDSDYIGEMLDGYQDVIDRDSFMDGLHNYLKKHRNTPFKELLFSDVPPILKWLKDHKYKIACASSSPFDYVMKALKEASIDQYFDIYVSGRDFTKNKPAPDCYLFCAKKLEVAPNECLVIEDSPNGILAAKNAEMKVVVRNDHNLDLNQNGGDYYLDNYDSLPIILETLNK